jgi:hypothetical protein
MDTLREEFNKMLNAGAHSENAKLDHDSIDSNNVYIEWLESQLKGKWDKSTKSG